MKVDHVERAGLTTGFCELFNHHLNVFFDTLVIHQYFAGTEFANSLNIQVTAFFKRKEIVQSKLLMVAGKLQIANGVTHLIVRQCFNITTWLRCLTETDLPQTLARGDETTKPVDYNGRSTEGAFHKGWNFP